MRARLHRRPVVLGIMACLGGCSSGSSEPDTAPGASTANPLDAEESAIVDAMNDLRAEQGADPLRACTVLNVSASKHSDDMRDRDYIDDEAPDGSTPATRACEAGYEASCDASAAIVELLYLGNADAAATLSQWTKDGPGAITDPSFAAIGVGRSVAGDGALWTADLATAYEPSCD